MILHNMFIRVVGAYLPIGYFTEICLVHTVYDHNNIMMSLLVALADGYTHDRSRLKARVILRIHEM